MLGIECSNAFSKALSKDVCQRDKNKMELFRKFSESGHPKCCYKFCHFGLTHMDLLELHRLSTVFNRLPKDISSFLLLFDERMLEDVLDAKIGII